MRRIILRMIATGSLSAFSSAALPALPSQVERGGSVTGAIQHVRATQVQPQPQPAPPVAVEQNKGSQPPTGRTLPRGSLLDLSV